LRIQLIDATHGISASSAPVTSGMASAGSPRACGFPNRCELWIERRVVRRQTQLGFALAAEHLCDVERFAHADVASMAGEESPGAMAALVVQAVDDLASI